MSIKSLSYNNFKILVSIYLTLILPNSFIDISFELLPWVEDAVD